MMWADEGVYTFLWEYGLLGYRILFGLLCFSLAYIIRSELKEDKQ